MSEQTLKFGDIVVDKKEFHASKQTIGVNLVDTSRIVVSDKLKHSGNGSKYFIGYLHDDDVITPLLIVLFQMSRYIRSFDNSGKNMSFKIEDEGLYLNTLKSGKNLKVTKYKIS